MCRCRPNIPVGAECYICLNQAAPGQLRGDLVRGCSCRGPHAGFAHIRCLVKNAEENGEHDDEDYFKALIMCGQCRQEYRGPVYGALMRAAWLHFAGRAETDEYRQTALGNLGSTLTNVDRLDEALGIYEEDLTTMRRLYGPDNGKTIEVEESIAMSLLHAGGPYQANTDKTRSALNILTRVLAWKTNAYGRDHELTLSVVGLLAGAQARLGNVAEAERLYRDLWAANRRVHGAEHAATLEAAVLLVETLVCQRMKIPGKIDEARDIYTQIEPVVRRVLGPEHDLARFLIRFAPFL